MATTICENCGTENPDNVAFCKGCGTPLPRPAAPSSNPASTSTLGSAYPTPASSLGLERRYSALRTIAALCKAIGAIFTVLVISGGALLFINAFYDGDLFTSFVAVVAILISAAATYIYFTAIAEIILVFLDIEENTRLTATLLKRQIGE